MGDWISVRYENLLEPALGKVLMIFDFRKQKFLSRRFLMDKYGTRYFPSENRVENDVYLLMKFSKDAQPANIGHCNVNQKLRLLKRLVMDDEPKYDLVPLTSFISKELIFEDNPCVPFNEEEIQQLVSNQQIVRNNHVKNLNQIFPVTEWTQKSFLSNRLTAEKSRNSSDGAIPYSMTDIDPNIQEITFVTNNKNELTSKKRGKNTVTAL